MSQYAPTSDGETRTMVYGVTGYENNSDGLPQSELDTLVKTAKLRLKTKTGSESWYSDSGLGQALVFTTAILAKAQQENLNVSSWSLGDTSVSARDSDGSSVQLNEWANAAADGLSDSDHYDNPSFSLTSNYNF